MADAKHTPGPWEADDTDIGFSAGGERDVCPALRPGRRPNGGFIIARLAGPDRAANARLIAAAPELLEALESVFRRRNEGTDAAIWAEWDSVAALIAKATGSANHG